MPMHDWKRVDAGLYHALHHEWITEINRAVRKRLPADYYSLPEQRGFGFGPDVVALTTRTEPGPEPETAGGTAMLARPRTKVFQESDDDFYVRKQKRVVVRHARGDRIVAVIEIVSPGNKDSQRAYRDFLKKARELLEHGIHMLIVDPIRGTKKQSNGIHFDIAQEFLEEPYRLPNEKPFCSVSYECDETLRSYVEPFAVGDPLADMPIYFQPDEYVEVPLEETYLAAFDVVPPTWREVLEEPA